MDVATFHARYDTHPGDRIGLFGAVAAHLEAGPVLYPGSFVDITPSVFFDDVTYVDMDRRAARFFARAGDVERLVGSKRSAEGRAPLPPGGLRFHHADYSDGLPLEDASVRLLVSLYAGFVSEHCSRYLATGGWLLANDSHGDASLAALDPRFTLVAVLISRSGKYRVRTDDLDRYMVPKRGEPATAEELHRTNKGAAFTRPAFAYLFQRS